jgi:hypothetical protein
LESLVKIVDGGSLLIALFNPVLFREWRKLNKMYWPSPITNMNDRENNNN